ncbi:hypothetical protein [Magnetospirillum moscoviense]|nr:hypothetical protein [Magnetospirillum moscoviense]
MITLDRSLAARTVEGFIFGDIMEIKGKRILTVSSPASAGKTDAAVTYAVDMAAKGHKVIIAQPTKTCIDEWFAKAKERASSRRKKPVPVYRFDSSTCEEGQVITTIMGHLKCPGEEGQVLFLTQQALLRLPYFHRPEHWHVIVDEIPAPDVMFCKHLPHNHEIITSAITWQDFSADNVKVAATDNAKLRRLADGDDAVDAEFRTIARAILDPDYDVFAIRENIERTVAGDTENGKYPLYLFGVLKPSAFTKFASAIIMGAHFEESLLHHLWAVQGAVFEPHSQLNKALRFQQHQNGHRVSIHYLAEDSWSKKLGGKKVTVDGTEISNTILGLTKAAELVGDQPFLYQVNKDVEDAAEEFFAQLPATALPHKPHGMNKFSDFHNVVVVASFLPTPMQCRFLSNFGITPDQIRDAICHQAVYQAVMRCSLRDLHCDVPVRVVVTDVSVAQWLADQFPGCTMVQAPGVQLAKKGKGHRIRLHADNSARVRAYRKRQDEQMGEVELANILPGIQNGKISPLRLANNIYSPIVTSKHDHLPLADTSASDFMDLSILERELFAGTLFRHIRDTNTTRHLFLKSMGDMIEWLRHCHGRTCQDKHSNFLISPTLFNPTLGDKSRGRENAVITWGIWLDIDDGDMPYHAFAKMFAGKAMVVYNTASSTNDTRYRVFMPTTGYMMAETYDSICKQIIKVVQSNGYCSPRQRKRGSAKPCHGIDPTKLSVENMMYLPCKPMDGSDGFFRVYDGDPINPTLWVQNNILPVDMPPPVLIAVPDELPMPEDHSHAAAYFEKLVAAIGDVVLGRNCGLYRASLHGFAMASAGLLDTWMVETRLEQAAFAAGLEKREIGPTIGSGRYNSRNQIGRYLGWAARGNAAA